MSKPTKKSIIKTTGIIGLATSLSRILGFLRDIVIANLFGTGTAAQAFMVAFRIPNLLRDLVGEGATNAAFVPVLSEYHVSKSPQEYWRLARIILNLLIITTLFLTIFGMIFSQFIVKIMAPGFIREPEKLILTIQMTKFIFPYIILVALAAYSMGILNSLGHFSSPAFGPCLFNITLILSGIFLCPLMGIWGLAWGVILGGIAQLAIQIPFMTRLGLVLDRSFALRHPGAKKIGLLLVPRALGSAVYQLSIFVDTIIASFAGIVGAGGVAALYYSNRLIQLPMAIFAIALATVALPEMSRYAALNEIEKVKETLSFSIKWIFFMLMPAGVGLMCLGKPIIRILFERGQFDSYSTNITQAALFFYSIGLFAYGGVKIMVSAFYALHDTWTPVKTAGAALLINVILNLILMWPLKIGGLALATSISSIFNLLMLGWLLQKRIGHIGTIKIIKSFMSTLAASLAMYICCVPISRKINDLINAKESLLACVTLLLAIIASAGIFLVATYLLNSKDVKEMLQWASKKK